MLHNGHSRESWIGVQGGRGNPNILLGLFKQILSCPILKQMGLSPQASTAGEHNTAVPIAPGVIFIPTQTENWMR